VTEATLITLARALVVSWFAVVGAQSMLALRSVWVGRCMWAIWLVPPLVWAYACTPWVATQTALPREVLGATVLLVRHLPVALLVLRALPAPPLDPAAAFLAGRGAIVQGWSSWLLGAGRNRLVAGIAVFALVFQEFELASLLRLDSWTVRIFDAVAAGMAWRDFWPWLCAPFAVQAAVLTCGWVLVRRSREAPTQPHCVGATSPRWAWGIVVAATLAAAGAVAWVLVDVGAGVRTVLGQGTLRRELLSSAVMAGLAIALVLAMLRLPRLVRLVLCAPVLCGGLLLGMGVRAVFQALGGVGGWLYDTPVPLVVGWAVWLLPLALLMREPRAAQSAAHSAVLLRQGDAAQRSHARRMLWILHGRRRLAVFAIWFAVLQGEVVLGALLAPTAATPAALRLYNLMHYGQSIALSGMVAALIVVGSLPLVVAGAMGVVCRHRRVESRRGSHP